MFHQLLLGACVTFASLMGAAVLWWYLKEIIEWMEPWLRRPPHLIKPVLVVMMVIVSAMAMLALGVWLWAFVLERSAAFSSLEEAVYFSLVAYTTLGLGDVVVPKQFRIIGGMIGANGFLMFGLLTATLTDSLRYVRGMQSD